VNLRPHRSLFGIASVYFPEGVPRRWPRGTLRTVVVFVQAVLMVDGFSCLCRFITGC
jgi:hypothetical protein